MALRSSGVSDFALAIAPATFDASLLSSVMRITVLAINGASIACLLPMMQA
jgi:hypothetical protein